MQDKDFMRLAIELAEKGRGWVNPNPMVGAVVVKNGKIIGRGYHELYGGLHAERNALAHPGQQAGGADESARGADLYVTLEPCCHHGKTPPCTNAIIEAGIRRVIIGAKDPNPLVAGKGTALLREHGIIVREGILKEECESQNKIFFHYMKTRRPYVILKYAMTMDGKIATVEGKSRWITGERAREQVHYMRHELMGIMAGVNTVTADQPMLNCRLPDSKNPIRIICDTSLRTPIDAYVVRTAGEQRTILATCCDGESKIGRYQAYGCEILTLPKEGGHVSLPRLMEELGKMGIDSILLEGGANLNWSALQSGIVNEIHTFLAPKIFGGSGAKTPVEGAGVRFPEDAFFLENTKLQMVGEDFLVISELKAKQQRAKEACREGR